jgi:hypothetical protein
MSERTLSRRSVLRGIGAATAATVAGTSVASATTEWTAVDTPVDVTLFDVESTAAGTYAVGGGGTVVERTAEGWRVVLDGGVTGNGNGLFGADVTDDGERLWVVGSSGAVGEYDVRTGTLRSHSAPDDVTNNFNDLSVTGRAGAANVYVAGDSGKVHYSFANGERGTWNSVTPGSGSNVNAVDFHGPRSGHAVDGNKTVFVTRDGRTWERLGIENANYNFYGVDSDGPDDVWAAGGGGSVYRWNGTQWRRGDTGDASLRALELAGDDGDGLAVGGGGVVLDREGDRWTREQTPTGANLRGVVRGSPDVAVGASGVVLER